MPEKIVLVILLALCIGQILAIFKGRLPAVIYFIVVAPLGYFSYWQILTWDLSRICGLLLIAADVFFWRNSTGSPRFKQHYLLLFIFYVAIITLVGSMYWPTDMITGRSDVYGNLRGVVQVFNWCITIGVGWQIGKALMQQGALRRVNKVVIVTGMFHCAYALYQFMAYYSGLPFTGLRRPCSGIGLDFGGEQLALDHYGTLQLFRVTSFVGEPKSFGSISLIWITALIALYLEGKDRRYSAWALILAFIILLLTFSTTAWAGAVGAVAIAVWVSHKYVASRLRYFIMLVLVLGVTVLLFNATGAFTQEPGAILSILEERSISAWVDVLTSGPSDPPEIEARKILLSNPEFALLGTGCGGISFYIANNLGGLEIVPAPNTGLLAMICDLGVLGVIIFLLCIRRGITLTLLPFQCFDPEIQSLSYMGCVFLFQCFIYAGGLLPFALGYLLAAEFRIRRYPQ